MSCPELALDRPTTAPDRSDAATTDAATTDAATTDAATTDSATQALAAIASTYEDARAGIISGEPSASADQDAEAPLHPRAFTGHSPTVPLTLMTSLKTAEPPQDPPNGEPEATTTLWSRLLRRGQAARRGRHSAPESAGLPTGSLPWGPPGRVRFLS